MDPCQRDQERRIKELEKLVHCLATSIHVIEAQSRSTAVALGRLKNELLGHGFESMDLLDFLVPRLKHISGTVKFCSNILSKGEEQIFESSRKTSERRMAKWALENGEVVQDNNPTPNPLSNLKHDCDQTKRARSGPEDDGLQEDHRDSEARQLEREKLIAERLERERLEAEQLERERLEAERLERLAAAERAEAEQLEHERMETADQAEAERLERLTAEKASMEERLVAATEEANRQKAKRACSPVEDDGEQNAESDNVEPAAKRRRDQLAVEVARNNAKKQGLVAETSNLVHRLTVHRNALREGSNPLFAAKTHLNKLIWMKVDKLFDPKSPNLRGVIPLARNVLRIIAPLVQWSKVLGMYHCSRAEELLVLARQAMAQPDLGENKSFANNLLSLQVAGESDERKEGDTEEAEIEVAVENLCAAISKQEGKRVSHTEVFDFLRLGWETRVLVYHLLHLCVMSKWCSMGTAHQLHRYSTKKKTETLMNRATSLFDRVVEMTGNNSIVFDDRTSILDFIERVILPAVGSVELHSLAAQVVIDARNSMTELSGKERDELFRGFYTVSQHDNGNGSGSDLPLTIRDGGGDYCGAKGKRNERDRMATLFCCLVAKPAIEGQLPNGIFSKSGGFTETLLRLCPHDVAKKCRPLFLSPKFFECVHEEGSDVAEKVKKEIIKSKVADDSSGQRTIIVNSFQQISSLETLTEF